jgi:hypothetical protein
MVLSSDPGRPGWTLYHIVLGQTPTLEDFQSKLGTGEMPRPERDGHFDPETVRCAAGVSCFETADQARRRAQRFPNLGKFIAELFIPNDDCAIEVGRTFPSAGHHTVWASPAYFLSRVVSIMPV